jgi:protein arginine N-methyltransferase 1
MRVESYLVPVSAEKAHNQVRNGEYCGGTEPRPLDDVLRKRGNLSRFDFYYDVILPRRTYLATPRVVRDYSFDGNEQPTYDLSTGYTTHQDGVFAGFKGYFIATLSKTVSLDISGDDIDGRTTSDSWKHCYLPIEEPVKVQVHDRITLTFSRRYPLGPKELFRQCYRWEGQVMRENTVLAHFAQDTGGRSSRPYHGH